MISTITKLSTVRLPIDETDLCGWIGQAALGDILEYHRGFLALDTASPGTHLPECDRFSTWSLQLTLIVSNQLVRR
jgi:hypothetical protein